MREKNRYNQMY